MKNFTATGHVCKTVLIACFISYKKWVKREKCLSNGHEIVRAQKKVSKGHPNSPPKSRSVVTDPQVYCEVICDRGLNQMLFK
jgi:hypothetical protein